MTTPVVDNLTAKIDVLEHAVKALQAHNEQVEAARQRLGAECTELRERVRQAEVDKQAFTAQLAEAQIADGVINAAAGKVQALTEAITSSLPA